MVKKLHNAFVQENDGCVDILLVDRSNGNEIVVACYHEVDGELKKLLLTGRSGITNHVARRLKRNEKMKREFNSSPVTLQELGDKYGITRERVRQIVGVKEKTRREITEALVLKTDISDLSRDDIVRLPGVKQVWKKAFANGRHKINGGFAEKGERIENLAGDKLSELGIIHKLMPHHHPYDIELNDGRKIDVKASFIEQCPLKWHGSPYYSFHIRKKQDDLVDYYILFIAPTNDFFIVPSDAVSGKKNNIHLVWPKRNRTSKWYKYHNRFDLLESVTEKG